MKSLSGGKVFPQENHNRKLLLGCAWLFDSALNSTDKEGAAPVRTISKPFLRASNVWHHQRNLFNLKLGSGAAGFIFPSGIQEAGWRVSWSSSLENIPMPAWPGAMAGRRGGQHFSSLSLLQPGDVLLDLVLGGAPSSSIQEIKK